MLFAADVPATYETIAGNVPEIAPGGTATITTFLPGLFKLGIGIASALAVIYIIIGGIQYLSTDAIEKKSDGKDKINNALFGLILAISSYVLLNTINPKLVNLDLSIEVFAPSGPIGGGLGVGTAVDCRDGVKNGNETGIDVGGRCGDGTNGTCFDGIKNGDETTADAGGRCVGSGPGPAPTGCLTCVPAAGTGIPQKGVAPQGTTNGACKYPGPCVVSPQMLTILRNLTQKMSVRRWQVTEMFPPTVPHADSCHNNGTCVDATVEDRTDNGLRAFFQAISESGARTYTYEVCGARLSELQNKTVFNVFKPKLIISCPGTTTGESVHIEL